MDERYEPAEAIVTYIADRTGHGITKQTFRKWRKPGGPASFVEVGSSGMNYSGQAAWTMQSSLNNLCDVILPDYFAEISEVRRDAARKSWADGSRRFVANKTDVRAGQAIREIDEIN